MKLLFGIIGGFILGGVFSSAYYIDELDKINKNWVESMNQVKATAIQSNNNIGAACQAKITDLGAQIQGLNDHIDTETRLMRQAGDAITSCTANLKWAANQLEQDNKRLYGAK